MSHNVTMARLSFAAEVFSWRLRRRCRRPADSAPGLPNPIDRFFDAVAAAPSWRSDFRHCLFADALKLFPHLPLVPADRVLCFPNFCS